MNDGDKNRLILSTLKNSSGLYSNLVPSVNASTTISQKAKKAIIVMIVKMTVFTLVRAKRSITLYAFNANSKKSMMQIIQSSISYGFFRTK